MRSMLIAAGVASFAAAAALAQPQQVVTPPKAVYWVSADTVSGLSAMGAMTKAQMMSGNIPTHARTLKLELGSTLAATSGAPNAAHDIPPALQMGRSLDLRTPQRGPAATPQRDPSAPPDPMEIKGRLLLFWGCGEHVGAGQPLIVNFAGLQRGQMPTGLAGASLNLPPERGPSLDTSRTFGEWPHGDSRPRMGGAQNAVPINGSLVGPHFIHGNYSPDVRFSLGADRDFLAPVELTQTKAASGSVAMNWRAIANATGYFAMVIGGQQSQGSGGDMVMWSSSARKLFGGATGQYIAPADAARLVGERVLLAPSATSCTVPVEVSQAAPQGFLMFSAYGPEANFVHPPRPADARTPWTQEWVAKVRFKSGMMGALGQNGAGIGAMAGMGGMSPEQAAEMQRQQCEMRRQQQGAMAGAVGSGIGAATGIPGAGMVGGALGKAFGKSRQKDQPPDPNCPPP